MMKSEAFENLVPLLAKLGIQVYKEDGTVITLFQLLNYLAVAKIPKEVLDDTLYKLNEIIMEGRDNT